MIRVHEDVIQVDEGVGDFCQEAVHQVLKRLGSVFQPKWHEDVLIKAKWSDDAILGTSASATDTCW